MTIIPALQHLRSLCDGIPARILAMDEAVFSARPTPEKWSRKEILGHLIDSATVNHHRFIRGQFEDAPRISYDQNAWNRHGWYAKIGTPQLVNFWEAYNRQLLALLEQLPAEALMRLVSTGETAPHTIGFLVEDYVSHLEHHLQQIFEPQNQ